MKYYYHFTSDKLRDGRSIPPVGKWLVHEGQMVICISGLHASEHPYDALAYAPGVRLHKVELRGIEATQRDKVCARGRKIVASIDAEAVLRAFARRVALDAVEKHWKNTPAVVLEYLRTGKEELRAKAASAARAAAVSAAVPVSVSAAESAWAVATVSAWAAVSAARAAAAAAAAAESAAESVSAAESAWAAAAESVSAAVSAARAAAAAESAAESVSAAVSAAESAWAAESVSVSAAAESAELAAATAVASASAEYRKWFLEMVEAEFSKSAKV